MFWIGMKVRQRFYIMIVMQKIMRSFSFSKMTGGFPVRY